MVRKSESAAFSESAHGALTPAHPETQTTPAQIKQANRFNT
jgi:hypothetical protein